MSIAVPLLPSGQLARLPVRAREVIEYRKSGLRLNHIQGCPLDCAYCIRHTYDLWDQRQPRALKLMSAPKTRRYRTILYWRPLVPGLNDRDEHLDAAYGLSQHADATVFTGLFYREQIAAYYRANDLPEPYDETARRKIVPETLERRILTAFADSTSLFRKTSCAVSYAHCLPDYNGHYGIHELCDICPLGQLDLCRQAHQVPAVEQVREVARPLAEARDLQVVSITERAAVVSGLPDEQPRYYLQHALGYQVHDVRRPHHARRHGRADIGWKDEAAS